MLNKANAAIVLQMISRDVEVNDYSNTVRDESGAFNKLPGQGVTEELWQEMNEHANGKGWKKGFADRTSDSSNVIKHCYSALSCKDSIYFSRIFASSSNKSEKETPTSHPSSTLCT